MEKTISLQAVAGEPNDYPQISIVEAFLNTVHVGITFWENSSEERQSQKSN